MGLFNAAKRLGGAVKKEFTDFRNSVKESFESPSQRGIDHALKRGRLDVGRSNYIATRATLEDFQAAGFKGARAEQIKGMFDSSSALDIRGGYKNVLSNLSRDEIKKVASIRTDLSSSYDIADVRQHRGIFLSKAFRGGEVPTPSASAPPPPRVEPTPLSSIKSEPEGVRSVLPKEVQDAPLLSQTHVENPYKLDPGPSMASQSVPPTKSVPNADLGMEAPQMPGELKIGGFKTKAQTGSATPPSGEPVKVETPKRKGSNRQRKNQKKAQKKKEEQELANQIADAREAAQKEHFDSVAYEEAKANGQLSKADDFSYTADEVKAATDAYKAENSIIGKVKSIPSKVKKTIDGYRNHEVELTQYQKDTAKALEGYDYPKAPEGKIKFGDTAAAHQKSVYQDTRNFSQELANAKNDEEMNKLFESRGITSITATDEGAARKALEQFQKNRTEAGPGFGDYMEAYHGHAAIAVGTVGMGAIKAFDNGGSRTNAQLYGMG